MIKILYTVILLMGLAYAEPVNPFSKNTNNYSEKEIKDKKYSEILTYLEQQGDGENLFYLANFYLNGSYIKDAEGKIVEKNTDLAEKYFKESIEKGFPFSAITLGSLYLYHEDFLIKENNVDKSEKYLNIAIEEEVFEAYTILADIYLNFKEDAEKFVNYLSKGAANNISTSQYALAVVYNKGIKSKNYVLTRNEEISSKFLTDACLNPKRTKRINNICYNKDIISKIKIGE